MLNLTYLALLEPGEDGCYGSSYLKKAFIIIS